MSGSVATPLVLCAECTGLRSRDVAVCFCGCASTLPTPDVKPDREKLPDPARHPRAHDADPHEAQR